MTDLVDLTTVDDVSLLLEKVESYSMGNILCRYYLNLYVGMFKMFV